MTSFRRTIAATAAAASLLASTAAHAATASAAALSLANAPGAGQDAAAASADDGGDRNVWINIGILAAIVGGVLLATGGDGGDDQPNSP